MTLFRHCKTKLGYVQIWSFEKMVQILGAKSFAAFSPHIVASSNSDQGHIGTFQIKQM